MTPLAMPTSALLVDEHVVQTLKADIAVDIVRIAGQSGLLASDRDRPSPRISTTPG